MTFEFQLLSLLLIFLLIIFNYYKEKNNITSKYYNRIILIAHIMQIISTVIYIFIQNNNNTEILSRIYFSCMTSLFLMYSIYYLIIFIKNKYLNNTKINEILKNNNKYFLLLPILNFIVVLPFKAGTNIYNLNSITLILITFYLLIEVLILIKGFKIISKKEINSLTTILAIQLISVFFQTRSIELPLLNIGLILIIYYNYFSLESISSQELRNIELEKEYAKKQSFDKTNFLKTLSREIRIPLNTIDGFGQVIQQSNNIEEIKNDIEDIRIASRDLIDVINGMIDLSIIESGNLEIIWENYNIYDMLDNIKEIVESKLRDKNIEFKTDFDNDIPEILVGDFERLSQVILNLLTNSIKYTNKGNITLKVKNVKSNTKCRLKIIVSDTGVGIKKEDLTKIFEGKTTKEGASLGLAVSKYILDQMGGSIEVESTYGSGSTFTITLDQTIIINDREEKITRKIALKPFKASDKRILIVDDNKLNLKVATKLLMPYEVEIIEAISGKECLEILEKDKNFDLILMDDMMPEMSGSETLSILKKIERVDGFYIPTVVLTANATSGMKEKYLKAGFEDYLSKPIDRYELDRILKKYLKK